MALYVFKKKNITWEWKLPVIFFLFLFLFFKPLNHTICIKMELETHLCPEKSLDGTEY